MSPGTTTSSSNGEGRRLSPPSISSKSEKTPPSALPDDSTFFGVTPTTFDIRENLRLIGVLILLSPLCLKFFTFKACLGILVCSYAIPAIIRLKYPRFMEANIVDDIRIEPGGSKGLIASITVVLLQAQNPRMGLAAKFHSEFYNRPLVRLLRTFILVEVAHNGTDEEKEKVASWLRWVHRHIHGVIDEETRKEFGISADIEAYGYADELNAYVVCMLTWASIAFQTRFGRDISKRTKDAIVLEYACLGLRIGIPEELLTKDYESFLMSFDQHLDVLDLGHSLDFTRSMVQSIEIPMLTGEMRWITRLVVRAALMIGFDLLPQRVRDRDQYQLKVLSTPCQRAIQKILIAMFWFFYPALMWLPLRGMICLMLILEPRLRPIFMSSLKSIHSMDILSDKPVYDKLNPGVEKANSTDDDVELLSYVLWLNSGNEGRTFLQHLLVRVLRTQLLSSAKAHRSVACVAPWMYLSVEVITLTGNTIWRSILDTAFRWKTQIKESMIFGGDEIKVPRHIGLVMDGNRRYAQSVGQSVTVGHRHGAQTAGHVLEWWLRFLPNTAAYTSPGPGPQYLTVWAFSSENFKRPKKEVDGLFRLMTVLFKNLAFSSVIHLFQIRVCIIGSREGLTPELLDAVDLLEETTRKYSRLFLQIAVGYGGRDEIVRSVRNLIARGVEVTEDSIGQGTFCPQIGVPPVELIVRTSERRTSGFFLWDTQTAELHFLKKLWPQLTEGDWLDAIASFSQREMRNGR